MERLKKQRCSTSSTTLCRFKWLISELAAAWQGIGHPHTTRAFQPKPRSLSILCGSKKTCGVSSPGLLAMRRQGSNPRVRPRRAFRQYGGTYIAPFPLWKDSPSWAKPAHCLPTWPRRWRHRAWLTCRLGFQRRGFRSSPTVVLAKGNAVRPPPPWPHAYSPTRPLQIRVA